TISGLFTWTGGIQCTGFNGTGCVTGTPNATTTANGTPVAISLSAGMTLNGRTLVNNGVANRTGTVGSFGLANGALFNNPNGSTLTVRNDGILGKGGGRGQAINSGGPFQKTGGVGLSGVYNPVAFNNTGSVQVSTGTLSFGGGGNCGGTCGGSWTVSNGTTLDFTFGAYPLSRTISGAGMVDFSG